MSRLSIGYVTEDGIRHIVANLRERDRREIFALRWDDDENSLVREVCHVAGELWRMWSWDQEPAAVAGMVPIRPGVVIGGAFGTHLWPRVVKSVTQWGIYSIVPILKSAGYHRLEVYVLAENTDSRRWIELMGGEVEALLRGFGRKREDYLIYVNDLTQDKEKPHVLLRRRQKRPDRTADGGARCH